MFSEIAALHMLSKFLKNICGGFHVFVKLQNFKVNSLTPFQDGGGGQEAPQPVFPQ